MRILVCSIIFPKPGFNCHFCDFATTTTVFLGVVSPSLSCLHRAKFMYIYSYLLFKSSTAFVVLSKFVKDIKTNKFIYDMIGESCSTKRRYLGPTHTVRV